jgi:hypothetical protein
MRTPSLAVLSLALAALAAVPSAAAPARAATARTRSASAGPRMVLPFIQDDYAKALAQARARKVPLFIESWAPW